ncbi:hypothetical protein BDZ45DRAFT_750421 [Acephala macrosclerotiorum]|nr:hypothetical protein BDZ45DRAFT_750421 [Acephala macrosclerotiorum]
MTSTASKPKRSCLCRLQFRILSHELSHGSYILLIPGTKLIIPLKQDLWEFSILEPIPMHLEILGGDQQAILNDEISQLRRESNQESDRLEPGHLKNAIQLGLFFIRPIATLKISALMYMSQIFSFLILVECSLSEGCTRTLKSRECLYPVLYMVSLSASKQIGRRQPGFQ